MPEQKVHIFNSIAFYSLLVTLFLLPIFFIPFTSIFLNVAKGFILVIGTGTSFLFWLLARLLEGTFAFPKNKFVLFVSLIPISGILSACFSPVLWNSFIGSGFDAGTALSLVLYALLFFLCSYYLRTNKQISYIYLTILSCGVLIGLFQIAVFIFGPTTLSLGGQILSKSSNIFGTWSDLGIFFGALALLSILFLEFIVLPTVEKAIVTAILLMSLFFIAVVNFIAIWIVLGCFALGIFIYTMANRRHQPSQKYFSAVSFVVVVLSLLFILANSFIGNVPGKIIGVYATDIRPSIITTYTVSKPALLHSPIFGVGPNRFVSMWTQYKPILLNTTPFWNTDFTASFGFIPTMIVTTGLIGLLAWLGFFGGFIYEGIKKIRSSLVSATDAFSRFILLSSFLMGLFMFIFAWIFPINQVLLCLVFVFPGIFIGTLIERGVIKQTTFHFLQDPRQSFFAITGIVLCFMVGVSGIYLYSKKFISAVLVAHALNTYSDTAPLEQTESLLLHALQFNPSDVLYRTLATFYIQKMNSILASAVTPTDTIKSQIQQLFSAAEQTAQKATQKDPTNYANWLSLGNVYATVVPFGVTNAYENAKAAYGEAQKRNPTNPSIDLTLAQLEIIKKNTQAALQDIQNAIKKKEDYADAYYLLSELKAGSGDLSGALTEARHAFSLDSTNPTLLLQVGALEYATNAYQTAIATLEALVKAMPENFDARYYLALSYEKIGSITLALQELQYIANAAPENTTIAKMISNLKAGLPSNAPDAPIQPLPGSTGTNSTPPNSTP